MKTWSRQKLLLIYNKFTDEKKKITVQCFFFIIISENFKNI